MAHPITDILAYTKRLKAAGENEAIAETHAEMLGKLIEGTLATKDDLTALSTKADINELKAEIKTLDAKIEAVNRRIGDQLTLLGVLGTLIAIFVGIHSFFPNFHF